MLSDFQIKKLTKIFNVFDVIKDDHLSENDFVEMADRYIKTHKLKEDAHKTRELREMYAHLWQECIQKPCDTSKDALVNLEEWLAACHVMLQTKVGHGNIDFIGTTIYESLDINHDRAVTIEEFTIFHQVYNIYDEKITPHVFSLMDNNHNGTLSKDEIVEAINQFFYSDNTKAPGNYLFGKL